MSELPSNIYTTRAETPYPLMDTPINFSECTREIVVMYIIRVLT